MDWSRELGWTHRMADDAQVFSSLTPDDEARLATQRAVVEQHLGKDAANLARYATVAGKLGLIRAVLEAKLFLPTQTYELQCLGIVLGDALVLECGWLWRMVSDTYGRDPCVKVPGSSMIAFPLTMISKRVERGEAVDVFELFKWVVGDVTERARTYAPQPD